MLGAFWIGAQRARAQHERAVWGRSRGPPAKPLIAIPPHRPPPRLRAAAPHISARSPASQPTVLAPSTQPAEPPSQEAAPPRASGDKAPPASSGALPPHRRPCHRCARCRAARTATSHPAAGCPRALRRPPPSALSSFVLATSAHTRASSAGGRAQAAHQLPRSSHRRPHRIHRLASSSSPRPPPPPPPSAASTHPVLGPSVPPDPRRDTLWRRPSRASDSAVSPARARGRWLPRGGGADAHARPSLRSGRSGLHGRL